MIKENYHQTEINGAKLAGYVMPGTHSVVVNVIIHAGSWYEKKGQAGFFHLLEHTLFGGTSQYPTKSKIDDYTERYGIVNNAWTGSNMLGVWFKFPDIYTNEALDLLEEMLFCPQMSDETIKKETKIITQEFGDHWNSPSKRFSKEFTNMILGKNHLYSRQPLSTITDLPQATHEIFDALHKEYFVPANMVISIAGNMDWAKIQSKFGKILTNRETGKLKKYKKQKIATSPDKLIYQDDTKQAVVAIDWILKDGGDLSKKERLTLNMIKQMLGNNRKSMLNRVIREELGIAYQTGCSIWDWHTDLALEAWAQVDKNNVDLAVNKILETVKEFGSKQYTKEEFELTRNFMNMQTLMYYDSVGAVSEDVALQLFYNKENKVFSPEETIEIAKQIKVEDIGTLFNRLVQVEQPYVGVLLEKSRSEQDNTQDSHS